ncbi:MAG: hypothetical protein AB7V77_05845 [Candidatus Woesearchaeota archaeon]
MENEWAKVIYQEGEKIRCIQGKIEILDGFYKIAGDFKTVMVNKNNIISIHKNKNFEGDC